MTQFREDRDLLLEESKRMRCGRRPCLASLLVCGVVAVALSPAAKRMGPPRPGLAFLVLLLHGAGTPSLPTACRLCCAVALLCRLRVNVLNYEGDPTTDITYPRGEASDYARCARAGCVEGAPAAEGRPERRCICARRAAALPRAPPCPVSARSYGITSTLDQVFTAPNVVKKVRGELQLKWNPASRTRLCLLALPLRSLRAPLQVLCDFGSIHQAYIADGRTKVRWLAWAGWFGLSRAAPEPRMQLKSGSYGVLSVGCLAAGRGPAGGVPKHWRALHT